MKKSLLHGFIQTRCRDIPELGGKLVEMEQESQMGCLHRTGLRAFRSVHTLTSGRSRI